MGNVGFSVVIPAYNEENTLSVHFGVLLPLLDDLYPGNWEVIVVDDGSSDSTAEIVTGYSHPGVRLLSSGKNRGKGAALHDGMLATRGELVLMCDADMATPPQTLRPFLEEMCPDIDIVIGNRRSSEARIVRRQSFARRVFGTCYKLLATRLLGVAVDDVNCGFKLFRGTAARDLFERTTTAGWAIDIEILALAARDGLRVAEVPVEWRDGDKSSVHIVRDIFVTLIQMFQLRLRL